MKKMLKLASVLLCVALCAALLVACGETTTTATTETSETAAEPAAVNGETFDAGNVTALVPNGWKAFPQHDVFSDDPKVMEPDVINIIKGGESDMDLFTKPYVRIDFGGEDRELTFPDKDFYDDVVDLEPITTGEHTWTGYSCDSLGTKLTLLFCEEGNIQYQATLSTDSANGNITLQDADVQAILASVAASTAS